MQLKYIISLIVSFCSLFSFYGQQITTDDSLPLAQLIQNNLGQNCVEISNISSSVNGSLNGFNSFGAFDRNNSDFPFQNGIVLTTGNVNSAGNVVNTSPLNEGDDSWGTDNDLENALGINETLNATSIKFNFVSVANHIQFNYILASEEYQQEYPCFYSDGFAFLIREAGSSSAFTNIAVIPGTSTPVNTNTIHDQIEGFCEAENEAFFEGYNVGDTNYNGRTVVLTATAAIEPNVAYEIKLIIADQNDKNFDSAVFIEGNSFNASVDLGPDITTCGNSVSLNGDIQNPQASYQWFQNDVLISGETTPDLEVLSSGTYKIVITIQLNETSCVIEDSVEIILNTEQPSTQITDYVFCDDSDDGIENFNLTTKNSEVLASVPPSSYNISYHYSNEDAQNNVNPIVGIIQNTSSPQPIFVRIEDTVNGCLAFSTFNLIVNEKPDFEEPDPLVLCQDSSSNDVTLVDLNAANMQIANGNNDLYITYHYSQPEADLGVNPILSPYSNPNISETLYVRVFNPITGCFSTTSIFIEILESPTINSQVQSINGCEEDDDGFENFDLTSAIDDILEGLTDVQVSFHTTYNDAQSNLNPIADPDNYQNTTPNFQAIFVRVQHPITGCFTITTLEIHTNIIETGLSENAIIECDDISNDGIADFDLNEVASELVNDNNDLLVTFFLTANDRANNLNAIDKSIPFNVINYGTTLYAVIADGENCDGVRDVSLVIAPAVILTPQSVDYCDEDNDGFTTLIMDTFNTVAAQGVPAVNVKYYLTEEDAINNENILPEFIYNTTNPQLLYIRVTNVQTDCFDISTLEVNVIGAPEITYPSDIIVCDDNDDGISTVNLEAKIPEITTSTTGLNITFYTDYDSAVEGENEITNPENYTTATQNIFARVDNITTDCYSLANFNVYINTVPQFIPITVFENCEADIDGVADFYFNLKDSEILNGQPDKQVLYYETEADALAGTNPIDKFSAYQNTTSPQTIYVRVESFTDSQCFGTSSFSLKIGSLPIYNPPSSIFICDDISNDGIATVDLNETINEIISGSPEDLEVTFHLSEVDANNNLNPVPLNYTNTINPQELFARVDNGNYCKGISAFEINVVSLPIVNPAEPLVQCDDNYDGIVTWDLTISEEQVLNVRQDSIVITYFESVEDLEADLNPIQNPENYTNTAYPQTIYIKINNTISNCYVIIPLELLVNFPPITNDFDVYDICENASDSFDLLSLNSIIVNNSFNVLINYFSSETDAFANENSLDTNYIYTSASDIIYVRVEYSTTHCFYIFSFELNVNSLPVANQPDNLIACDDDFDGFFEFNLNQQTPIILGNQNPNNFNITYYNNQLEAEEGINEINSESYNGITNKIITARIENNVTGCFSLVDFSLIVNQKPDVNIPDQVICIDNLPLVVSADTFNPTDTYVWSTNQIGSEIEITEEGQYSVTVTSEFGCSTLSTFNVTESQSAINVVTETVDFSDPNNITITIEGIGNYLYILDDEEAQTSNVFENVSIGYHTITIIDLNGCASVYKDVVVIDAPKYFTPNNDDVHDTWHIVGIETLPGSIVYIFDRYGKLITQLGSDTQGWDGTYNGHNLPASDYWFSAEIQYGNTAFEVKGHFALRR